MGVVEGRPLDLRNTQERERVGEVLQKSSSFAFGFENNPFFIVICVGVREREERKRQPAIFLSLHSVDCLLLKGRAGVCARLFVYLYISLADKQRMVFE